jgi:hypothetical protein
MCIESPRKISAACWSVLNQVGCQKENIVRLAGWQRRATLPHFGYAARHVDAQAGCKCDQHFFAGPLYNGRISNRIQVHTL